MSSLFPAEASQGLLSHQRHAPVRHTVTSSPQETFQGFSDLGVSVSVIPFDCEEVPPCEKGEECYMGGCDMCTGQRHRLAQSLQPQLLASQQELFS